MVKVSAATTPEDFSLLLTPTYLLPPGSLFKEIAIFCHNSRLSSVSLDVRMQHLGSI